MFVHMMALFPALCALAFFISLGGAKCYEPSPAFPVPSWEHGVKRLEPAFNALDKKLEDLAKDDKYATSSFSIAVTSNTETLWSHYHSARIHNATRPGVKHVDGDSQYRIASITKTFTTLALLYQHAVGNLSLDDPISKYISEFASDASGDIPWKHITLRIVASQLSGIPREMAQNDMINGQDPTNFGLPPATKEGLPYCYEYNKYKPCTRQEVLADLKRRSPIFAPNQKSTYSNVNFELLGLVIEEASGLDYRSYIHSSIFSPLNMTYSSLETPPDHHAVLPLGQYFWDVDEGRHSPTGGIYSSSTDMSKFLRYILTTYNSLVVGVNWLLPASWAEGTNSFYGMPFEIFRTSRILEESSRPITFVTKSGGVPMYASRITLIPEYGLGITILVAGDGTLVEKIQELVTVDLTRAAESLVWEDIDRIYSGSYSSINASLNSSLVLAAQPSTGLTLNTFISNSTDVSAGLLSDYARAQGPGPWHAQLIPTLLYKNESTKQGEIWRLTVVRENDGGDENRPIWDDFCVTDIDMASYAGLPVNEVVFWHEEHTVEFPAWKVKMRRVSVDEDGKGRENLVVQPPV